MFIPMADDKRLKLVFERGPVVPQYIHGGEARLRQVLVTREVDGVAHARQPVHAAIDADTARFGQSNCKDP